MGFGSLGAFDTKRGIFGPGGHGGGIFQTTVNGLGSVPWQCWDTPGFKDCNTEQGHEAHRLCGGGYFQEGTPEFAACHASKLEELVQRNCVSRLCGSGSGSPSVPSSAPPLPTSPPTPPKTSSSSSSSSSSSYSSSAMTADSMKKTSMYGEQMSTNTKLLIAGASVAVVLGGYLFWKMK